MTLLVRFLGAARAELRDAVNYDEAQVSGLGDEFAAEAESAVRLLASHPEIGAPYLVGTRRILVPRFPFSIVYQIRSGQAVIIAVAHQRRRPGYWRKRL